MKRAGVFIGGLFGFLPGAFLGCVGRVANPHNHAGNDNLWLAALGGGTVTAILGAFIGFLFTAGQRP